MKKTIWNRPGTVILAAVFCCLLWGSAAPFIKTGYTLFSIQESNTPSILLFAGLRFFLAGVLVLVIASIRQKKILLPTKTSLKAIPVLALFQTSGQYFFYYVGLAHTSGVNGSIISGTSAFFSLLVAAYIFHYEKMNLNKAMGCILGFFGILCMNLQDLESFSLFGDGFIFLSQFCSALSAGFIKFFTSKDDPVLLSGYQFCLGGLVLMCIGLAMHGSLELLNIRGLAVLLYLAFVSACAYTVWGILLSSNPLSKIGIFSTLIPVMGVLLSAVLLNETSALFSITTICALGCIVVGIAFVNRAQEDV